MEQSLVDLRPGETGMVRKLEGGRNFVARLAALGFTIGVPAKVVRANGHGPLLVSLRGTQVALGYGEAEGIRISPQAEASSGWPARPAGTGQGTRSSPGSRCWLGMTSASSPAVCQEMSSTPRAASRKGRDRQNQMVWGCSVP